MGTWLFGKVHTLHHEDLSFTLRIHVKTMGDPVSNDNNLRKGTQVCHTHTRYHGHIATQTDKQDSRWERTDQLASFWKHCCFLCKNELAIVLLILREPSFLSAKNAQRPLEGNAPVF